MKIAKNLKVGDLVEIPIYEFAPLRSGWNGWIFRVGVVEKLYISKSGKKCATVRYCSRCAGRYELLPAKEVTKNVLCAHCFKYERLELATRNYREFREAEKMAKKYVGVKISHFSYRMVLSKVYEGEA